MGDMVVRDGIQSAVSQITTANEATDTTCFPVFVTSATGDVAPKTNTNLTFNSNTGALGATTFVGAVTGAASQVVAANEATDTTCFPLFVTDATGSLAPKTNAGLAFNSNTGALAVTSISGDGSALTNVGGTYYGGMYWNANANATVIETANIDVLVRQFTTGSVSGWTYTAGLTAGITAYADYSGTVAGTVAVTSATHGLVTGDIISIRGTTNYNGVFAITKIDDNTFYIVDTWVADDGASDWDMGSYLKAGANAAGVYMLNWHASATAATATESFLYTVYKNTSTIPASRVSRKYSATDIGAFGGCAIVSIAANDRISFAVQNIGATHDITFGYGDIVLFKIK